MKKYYVYILPLTVVLVLIAIYLWRSQVAIVPFPAVKTTKLRAVAFEQLPGWPHSGLKKSFEAFQLSCKPFLRQNPEKAVGSKEIFIQAKDWQPACRAALAMNEVTGKQAQRFFKHWFQPVEFYEDKPVEGLFTGYYSPLLKGSLTRSEKYSVPLYDLPSDLVEVNLQLFDENLKHRNLLGRVNKTKLIPYYSRKEINKGAIKKTSKVIVWVEDAIDRQFLEIQGSGIVELDNGKRIYVGYTGENGAPYTSLARVLIDKGVMTRDNASMQGIKRYLQEHKDEKQNILNQNKSFVFFRKLGDTEAYGAQGVALTPGYSLAIDRKWIPLGTPVWLSTTSPGLHSDSENTLQRLMIAQDTGGAIKGAVRGDFYWGAGKEATYNAGHMKNKGFYWLLLPRQVAKRML